MLIRLYDRLDRHPAVGDAALAVVILILSLGGTTDADTAERIVFSVLFCAPLVLRSRYPVGVFAVLLAISGVQLAVADELVLADAAVLVGLYTLVAQAPRRLAALGTAITLAGALPLALRFAGDENRLVVFGVVVVHIGLAAALGDRSRARREEARRAAVLEERARIARELHDVVAHSLSVVIAQADGGRYAAAHDPEAAPEALRTIAKAAREAQQELRRALGVLRDEGAVTFEPQPGPGEIPALLERVRDAGVPVELVEAGAPRALPPAAGLTVYRVAQEALTNVLKHAGADARATVTLEWQPAAVTLTVINDGKPGHNGNGNGHDGRGLTGMHERVTQRGGTLEAGPRPGGFQVRAEIPA